MKFLIDENLPASLAQLFVELGGEVEFVYDIPALRGEPDEAIFEHAVAKGTTIVTRDLGFANPTRFLLSKLAGLVIIRFPNEISTMVMSQEIYRLVQGLSPSDFHNLIVIEPGSIRKRKLPGL